MTEERIAVLGVGYVGLPLALALARVFRDVRGYDVDASRIEALKLGRDWNDEADRPLVAPPNLCFTHEESALKGATVFIVTVPTPIDASRRPDLGPIEQACRTIAHVIAKGALVIVESTVYPGVVEEFCGPIIARESGLTQGTDFKLGYSPERINPADDAHRLDNVVKIISAQDAETLERVARLYEPIVHAGLHRAPSIQVAEAAKVTENIQRDVNIALVNELARIFDRLGLRTHDILEAAGTKWNFMKFKPGLVGGHCIGVDPYYLIARAESFGYYPEVIRASRRLNNGMGGFIAERTVKLLTRAGRALGNSRIGILGLTFKEDVTDIRNSQVPEIVRELGQFGARPLVHDPHADPHRVREEYGIELVEWDQLSGLDALVIAVAHRVFLERKRQELFDLVTANGVIVDIKSVLAPGDIPAGLHYWSL
ncbi:MAG: nucleotide sugar dehydrogenase [Alphaproteobacteria bacterium]|nr:nucleotide sugar dehydrogenase [Alphaproteobacteria bacterium]